MSYETVIQEVEILSSGKRYTFKVCAEPGQPDHAVVGDTSKYFDMDTFNAGLAKADGFIVRQIADMFDVDSGSLKIPDGFRCKNPGASGREGLEWERQQA